MAGRDEQALGILYDRWSQVVFSVAIRLLDEDEAEEVVEETFWQAWRQADRFQQARGNVGAWLTVIARSRALERRRNRVRVLRLDQEFADQQAVFPGKPAIPCPAGSMESAEVREMVLRAIGALPAPQREAVTLAFLGGLSHREISQKTGDPLGTVKTRIRSALARLRLDLAMLRE